MEGSFWPDPLIALTACAAGTPFLFGGVHHHPFYLPGFTVIEQPVLVHRQLCCFSLVLNSHHRIFGHTLVYADIAFAENAARLYKEPLIEFVQIESHGLCADRPNFRTIDDTHGFPGAIRMEWDITAAVPVGCETHISVLRDDHSPIA